MGTWTGLRALIHARESVFVAKDGNRSTQEQVDESRVWCETEGIEIAAVIVEEDISGAAKNREKWERAKRLLHDGDASGPIHMLVSWSSSRAQRDLDEYVKLRRLCVEAGVLWCYGGRVYDMTDGDDRFRTAIDGAVSERDLAEIRKNVMRAMRANAVAGRPHGHLLFGYRRIYDAKTRAFIRQEPDPETAPIVRQIFSDYLSGHSLGQIARSLNDRGIATPMGRTWKQWTVDRLVSNRGYLGERIYWTKDARKNGDPPEMVVKDAWPPLVDVDTFDKVQARRASRGFRRQTSTARLLTGIAICGAETDDGICGAKLDVLVPSNRKPRYACPRYHGGRLVERLDTYVRAHMLERLARSDVDELLAGSEDPAVVEARERAAKLRAELDEAWELRRTKRLSLQRFSELELELTPQIEEADQAARRAFIPIQVDVPAPEKLPEWWDDELTAEQRREITAAWIVAVTVLPVGRGRRNYDMADYTIIDWRQPGATGSASPR